MSRVPLNGVAKEHNLRKIVLKQNAAAKLGLKRISVTELTKIRTDASNLDVEESTMSPDSGPNHEREFYSQKRKQVQHNAENNGPRKRFKEDALFSSSKGPHNHRRASWEMDIVNGNGESMSVAQQESRKPSWAMDWQSTDRCGTPVPKVPLYSDVRGCVPYGHEHLFEQDPYNIALCPTAHQQELDRALKLSEKPIPYAPAWFHDLPWDDIEGISIEEFVIYFPNHAARWPGIALWLRCQGWDRLFFRAMRLINLARDTHYVTNRDDRVIEVFPLMLKVQAAIQELLPNYDITKHDMYNPPSMDYIMNHIKDKPRGFPSNARTVTVEEAAGYCVGGTNEFPDRTFSKKILQIQEHFMSQKQEEEPVLKFPFMQYCSKERPEPSLRSSSSKLPMFTDAPMSREPTSTSKSKDPVRTPSPPPADEQNAFRCEYYDDCDDVDCPWKHVWQAKKAKRQDPSPPTTREDREPVQKVDRICRNAGNCERRATCKFLHVGEEGYDQALLDQLARQSRDRKGCDSQEPKDEVGSKDQTRRESLETESQQAKLRTPPRALCRHNAKCKNGNCPFGHRSRAADDRMEVNLEQSCKFGALCSNARCNRTHPSPASIIDKEKSNGSDQNKRHRTPEEEKNGRTNHPFRGHGRGRGRGRGC